MKLDKSLFQLIDLSSLNDSQTNSAHFCDVNHASSLSDTNGDIQISENSPQLVEQEILIDDRDSQSFVESRNSLYSFTCLGIFVACFLAYSGRSRKGNKKSNVEIQTKEDVLAIDLEGARTHKENMSASDLMDKNIGDRLKHEEEFIKHPIDEDVDECLSNASSVHEFVHLGKLQCGPLIKGDTNSPATTSMELNDLSYDFSNAINSDEEKLEQISIDEDVDECLSYASAYSEHELAHLDKIMCGSLTKGDTNGLTSTSTTLNDLSFDFSNGINPDEDAIKMLEEAKMCAVENAERLHAEREARLSAEQEATRLKIEAQNARHEEVESLKIDINSLSDTLSSRDVQIRDLKKESEKLNKSINELNISIAASQDEVHSLRNSIKNRESEVTQLKNEVAHLTQNVENRDEEIFSMNGQIVSYKETISTYERQVDEMKSDAITLKAEIASRDVKLDFLQNKIKTLHGTAVSREKETNELKSKMSSIEDAVTVRDTDIKELHYQTTTFKDLFATKENEVIEQKSQLSSIEESLEVSDKEAISSKETITCGEVDIEGTTKEVTSLAQTIRERDEKITALNEQVTLQTDSIENYKMQVRELDDNSTSLEKVLKMRESELYEAKAEISSLNHSMESRDEEARGLQTELASYVMEVSALQELISSRELNMNDLKMKITSLMHAIDEQNGKNLSLNENMKSPMDKVMLYEGKTIQHTSRLRKREVDETLKIPIQVSAEKVRKYDKEVVSLTHAVESKEIQTGNNLKLKISTQNTATAAPETRVHVLSEKFNPNLVGKKIMQFLFRVSPCCSNIECSPVEG